MPSGVLGADRAVARARLVQHAPDMPPRATPLTEAVVALGLPHEIARRLARALDKYLVRPSAGHHPLRLAVRATIGALLLDGAPQREIRGRLVATVAGHAEERGFYERSVVRGIPRYHRACDLVERWVDELVSEDDEGIAAPPELALPAVIAAPASGVRGAH